MKGKKINSDSNLKTTCDERYLYFSRQKGRFVSSVFLSWNSSQKNQKVSSREIWLCKRRATRDERKMTDPLGLFSRPVMRDLNGNL
jgi:hypothetical protein